VGKSKGMNHWEEQDRWEDDIKIYLQQYVRVWTGHVWLRIQASDGLLRTWKWTYSCNA